MPRKPLDVRKAYGRLFANGKQKAPSPFMQGLRKAMHFTLVCLKFIDVFDIISIWIGLIITDLP